MSGKFKARCPRCDQRTSARFRLELDAFLCDQCNVLVLSGAPPVLEDETPAPGVSRGPRST